jgi:hypothetical protein
MPDQQDYPAQSHGSPLHCVHHGASTDGCSAPPQYIVRNSRSVAFVCAGHLDAVTEVMTLGVNETPVTHELVRGGELQEIVTSTEEFIARIIAKAIEGNLLAEAALEALGEEIAEALAEIDASKEATS